MQQYDSRNDNIQIFVGDRLHSRAEAKVSVFDSIVQGGDGVWEGIRVYDGKIFCLEEHLNRMQESAKTMFFENIPSKEEIRAAIFKTLKANGQKDETHIRLTLSRGLKTTSGMDPQLNQFGCTLIVVAEWKPPIYPSEGISLATASTRRNSPQNLDSKIHHNNLINNILAKIEGNLAGADDAIMLDNYGFVSETNATNIFHFKNGKLYTPHADACLPGVTRMNIIRLANENGISISERNISVSELYNADEVFTTGTMGELTRVHTIDQRKVENKFSKSMLQEMQGHYSALTKEEGEQLTF
jgi:branched-chain amino acid aminotransferase